ncbi:MAG TPA: GGDEF domain-containing protein, partial [Rhodocyclaceae bacterium]
MTCIAKTSTTPGAAAGMTPSRYLRGLLVFGLIGANLLVFALVGYSLYQSRQQYELRAQALTQNIARALDQSVSNSIEKIDLALRSVADELEQQLAARGRIDEEVTLAFLAKQEQRLPDVEAFRVANADGLVILSKGLTRQERPSWADRDYFLYLRSHQDGGLRISKPLMGRVAKRYLIPFARRYNYPDGRFAGVVTAPIALDHVSQLLARFDLGPKGTVILRDADLGLIARHPPLSGQTAGEIGNNGVSEQFRQVVASGLRS